MPATLAESRVKAGQYIVFSRWINTKAMILPEIGFDLSTGGLEKLYRDIFTTPEESAYHLTSIIAEHLMGGPELSGLLYPSIINQNGSENVVLKSSFVDESMKCIYASLYHIKNIDGQIYETEELDFAKPDATGKLDWRGRIRNWTIKTNNGELRMVSNGWDWNAYLPDGTYVEPE